MASEIHLSLLARPFGIFYRERISLQILRENLRPHMLRNEQGFTLVELITGIMIMAILSLAVAPQVNGLLRSFRLGGATKVVWGDLHRARLMAIKEGRTIRVDFTSNSYDIVRVDTAEMAFRRMLSVDYPDVTVSITNNTISFGSTGTAGGGGKTVELQSPVGKKCFTILTTGRIGNFSCDTST
jgi:prepilin-type N-terminal cleavage/methylation domain-containing protein